MTTPGDVTAVWASARVTELTGGQPGGIPEYGSAAWLGLPAADPRRPAALITAAECWRRQEAERERLAALAEDGPEGWFDEVVEPANEAARQLLRGAKSAGRPVSSRPTFAELARRRGQLPVVHPVRAAPGWPPVAIPGRPGWWRHLIDGAQVDLPSRGLAEQQQQEAA